MRPIFERLEELPIQQQQWHLVAYRQAVQMPCMMTFLKGCDWDFNAKFQELFE